MKWVTYDGTPETLPAYDNDKWCLVHQQFERDDGPPHFVVRADDLVDTVEGEHDSGEPFQWAYIPTPEQCEAWEELRAAVRMSLIESEYTKEERDYDESLGANLGWVALYDALAKLDAQARKAG